MKIRRLHHRTIIAAVFLAVLFWMFDLLLLYILDYKDQVFFLEFLLLPSPAFEVVHRALYTLVIFGFTIWIAILLKRHEEMTEIERQISTRLNHFLTSSLTIIYAVRIEGNALVPSYVSENLTRLLGYTVQEAMEPTWWATHIHPEDSERVFANVSTLFENNLLKHEYRFIHNDGSIIWIYDELRLLRDSHGKPIEAVGYWIDITESKKIENLIKENEERFRSLYDNSTIGLYRTTPDGKILLANPALVKMLGYDSFEELTKRDLEKSGYGGVNKRNEFRKILEENDEVTGLEAEWYRKDGTVIFVSEGSKAVRDEAGNIIYYDGTVEDITERKRAEDALIESERIYREVVENASDIIYSTDLNGRFTYANAAGLRAIGYPLEELTKLSYLDVILPEYRGKVRITYFRQFLEKLPSSYVEFPFFTNVGGVRWFGQNASPILENQSVVGFHVIARDITERKQAEEALRENGLRFRTIWEKVNDGMRITDEEGIVVLVNDAYCKMVEKPREEIIGKPMSVIFEETRQAETLRKHQERFRSRSIAPHLERDIVLWNGRRVSLELSNTFLEIPHQPVLSLSVFRDITERKQTVKKIEEQARLLDEASDAIIEQDLLHTILYWNKSAERIFGWSAEEVLDKDIREILYRDKIEDMNSAIEITLKEGAHEQEIHHITKNGKKIIVHKRMTIIRDDSGKPKSILSISTDITERKNLESQVLRTQRLESLGTLAGGVAHDLNNVLAPILLTVEILKDSVPDIHGLTMLEMVEKSARRGSDIVNQVLAFARGKEGDRAVIQIRHIVKETMSIVKHTFPKSISIKQDISTDLWTVFGDATQLHQLLMNLCVNARDAMPDGGTLSVSAENKTINEQYARKHVEAKPGSYLMLVVQDTGTGMPPEIRDRIFDPFFTTKEQGKGTGLGLSTVYSIVKSHDGFMTVESEMGKGSAFGIYLPASEFAQEPAATVEQEFYPPGNGELILIVDDEESILQITKQTLETFRYKTLTASDGNEAVALYTSRGKEIALVLTDLMMPNMDGAATIRALRTMNPSIKIIASSGLVDKRHLIGNEDTATDAFIAKPYTADKLLNTLHQVLRGQST